MANSPKRIVIKLDTEWMTKEPQAAVEPAAKLEKEPDPVPLSNDLVQKVVQEAILESKADAQVQQTATDQMLAKAMKEVGIDSKKPKPSRTRRRSSSSSGSSFSEIRALRSAVGPPGGDEDDPRQVAARLHPEAGGQAHLPGAGGARAGRLRLRAASPRRTAPRPCGLRQRWALREKNADLDPGPEMSIYRVKFGQVVDGLRWDLERVIRSFGPSDRFEQLLGSLLLRSKHDVQSIVTGVDQSIHNHLRVYYNEEKRIFSVRSPHAERRPSQGGPQPPKSAPPRAAQPVKGPARGSLQGPKSAHPTSFWSGAVPAPSPFSVWPISPAVPTGRKKPRAAHRLLASTPKAAPEPTSIPIFFPPDETPAAMVVAPSGVPPRHMAMFYRSLADIMDAPPPSAAVSWAPA